MALLWCDGFDHYGQGSGNSAGTAGANVMAGGYSYFAPTNTNIAGSGFQRTGSAYLHVHNIATVGCIRLLDSAVAAGGVGCGVNIFNTPGSTRLGIRFVAANSAILYTVSFRTDNSIGFHVGDSTAALLGATPANTMPVGSWAYVECKITGSGAGNGRAEIRVNSVTVLIVTGFTNSGFAGVALGYPYSVSGFGHSVGYDDFVIWDTSGPDNNDFLGDRRCITMYPSSNAATQQWTAVGGANAWDCVNESPPNTSDYIEAANAGDVSEFNKTSLTVLTTGVAGIRLMAYAQKNDAGVSTFRLGINSGGNVNNSSAFSPGTSWGYFSYIVERDPNGNIAWVKSSVESATLRLTRDS